VDHARLERIAAVIVQLDADLVALQEVALMTVNGEGTDMAAVLAARTGMEARYAAVGHFPIIDPDRGEPIGACFWGNAVLSRLPVAASRTVALPGAADEDLVEPAESALELAGVRYADAPIGVREPRCALVCELQLHGSSRTDRLTVVSTHLTHIGSGQRAAQADRLAGLADGLDRVVVAGDLNAPIDRPELAPLGGLTDAFTAVGVPVGDDRRLSCGPHAIDHVLVAGARPVSCRVALEAGDASDHWPVVAEIAL
jgi:endonuclease/exonuclease/phosphatase family metal-dependent hydrolase